MLPASVSASVNCWAVSESRNQLKVGIATLLCAVGAGQVAVNQAHLLCGCSLQLAATRLVAQQSVTGAAAAEGTKASQVTDDQLRAHSAADSAADNEFVKPGWGQWAVTCSALAAVPCCLLSVTLR